MKKRKKKNSNNVILSIIVFLIFTIIAMIIIVTSIENIKSKDNKMSDEQIKIEVQKKKEEEQIKTEEGVEIARLLDMEERDRIEYYFSKFINAVESQEYEKAYEMLHDEYKENYFPTIAEFKKYAKKTFPKMIAVEHTNFERSGDVYILFVNVSNSLSPDSKKEMKFVVKENELNDFVMSFSVI